MLVANLPRGSATVRALNPENEWSQTDYLLAAVVDLLAGANWQRGGDKKAQRPKPVPRPGDVARPSRPMAEIKADIDAWDKQHRKKKSKRTEVR